MRAGMRVVLVVCLFAWSAAEKARAQIVIQYPGLPRYEIGAQFSAVQLNGPAVAGSLGVGLHFGYNYNQYLSLETEVNRHSFASSTLDTTSGFFGPRIGYTSREAGIYVKVRPGFIHFPSHGDLNPGVLQHPTNFAFDTGVVVTRYFPNHVYLRFDAGSMLVNYGGGSYTDPITGQVTRQGAHGSVSVSFGFGAHF